MGTLSIQTTNARLDIRTTRAAFQYSGTGARPQASSKPLRFSMNTKLPKVKIDQTQSFANMGDVPVLQLSRENAQRSMNIGLQGIARIADDGNYVGNLVSGGNRVAQLARENATRQYDGGVNSVPYVGPEISLERQELGIEWEPFQLLLMSGQYEFVPGTIEISMAQWPEIVISYIIDEPAIGSYVDRVI